MAYEILNQGQITPYRLHAMVRLVPRLTNPRRSDLFTLLQPDKLTDNQGASEVVYEAAIKLGLLTEDEETKRIQLTLPNTHLESIEGFREVMQQKMLGIINDYDSNALFNLYTAWYAVQDAQVLRFETKEFETRFNEQLYPHAETRSFNTTKLPSWRKWAIFLGLGWPLTSGNTELMIPDASVRITPLLVDWFSQSDERIEMNRFMDGLAETCPELDGGLLFMRCWHASRASETRSNRISLMLSNALRLLHDEGTIELLRMGDASTMWSLYPAEGHPIQSISHIRRRSN